MIINDVYREMREHNTLGDGADPNASVSEAPTPAREQSPAMGVEMAETVINGVVADKHDCL